MYYLDNTFLIILPEYLWPCLPSTGSNPPIPGTARSWPEAGLPAPGWPGICWMRRGLATYWVNRVQGTLTDHYDPIHRTLNLSERVYGSSSIAALGVAAHECGHALQHLEGYEPLKLRSAVVPTVNIGSSLSWPIFLAGMISGWRPLLAGVMLFSLTVLFSLITLPVEFNASRRAMAALEGRGLFVLGGT